MLRFFYNLAWPFGLLFFLPRYLVKMFRRGGYREKFGQRLGSYDENVRHRLARTGPRTWIHAVSVGEIVVALKLLDQLRRLEPDGDFILTTTTTTAFAMAQERGSGRSRGDVYAFGLLADHASQHRRHQARPYRAG